jgi:hypothetical protein
VFSSAAADNQHFHKTPPSFGKPAFMPPALVVMRRDNRIIRAACACLAVGRLQRCTSGGPMPPKAS